MEYETSWFRSDWNLVKLSRQESRKTTVSESVSWSDTKENESRQARVSQTSRHDDCRDNDEAKIQVHNWILAKVKYLTKYI